MQTSSDLSGALAGKGGMASGVTWRQKALAPPSLMMAGVVLAKAAAARPEASSAVAAPVRNRLVRMEALLERVVIFARPTGAGQRRRSRSVPGGARGPAQSSPM